MRISLAAIFVAMLMLGACSNNGNQGLDTDNTPVLLDKGDTSKNVSAVYVDPSPDWTWDLIAGQNNLAGTVTVTNDEDTLYVSYNTLPDWPMIEAQVYVGDEPPSKGNPGQFPYKVEFDPSVFTYTFEIPLGDFEYKSEIFLATHASVGPDVENHETAWGGYWNDGDPSWDFTWGNKWGGGFSTRVMPMPELPDDTVSYKGFHYGTYSYWDVLFLDPVTLPPGSFVHGSGQTRWVGWCVDKHHTMYANKSYDVTLYSSYDSSIPAFGQNDNWDLINYMVNQRRSNASSGIWNQNWTSNGIKNQFQAACWYFSDGIEPASGSLAEQFVNDAKANGENFIPGPGEFYAIILYPNTDTNNINVRAQMNIIEVDP